MYALLSPAKRMDFDKRQKGLDETTPLLAAKTGPLIAALKGASKSDLADLMHLSDNLAQLNYDRYQSFDTADQTRAIEAFQGDTYIGFDAASMSKDELSRAQSHVGILSGLYGLLRPLDVIKPYRLEMGTKLSVGNTDTLYDYWGDDITDAINTAAKGQGAIINLASNEYIKAVNPDRLNAPFIMCDFKENKNGTYKTIGIYAKKARGMMARYIVKNRVTSLDALKQFDHADYQFKPDMSDDKTIVFVR